MKEVIDAIIDMLHRKGIVTDDELRDYNRASYLDNGSINPPVHVIASLKRMAKKEETN